MRKVWLNTNELRLLRKVARARQKAKDPSTDRAHLRFIDGAWLHYCGLRGELAVAKALGLEEIDLTIDKHGDGGIDLLTRDGASFQVKATTRNPPWLRFDPDGSQRFQADFAALTRVEVADVEPQQVEVWGCIKRETFLANAVLRDMGYGPKLVIDDPKLLEPM
jgi:predicted nucleic acid-binding protein